MSKESFSKKISESMQDKMYRFSNFDFDGIYEDDEYFELSLCLAYMALSKEKIILKDKDNPDTLARITSQVDVAEIDKVFQPGFAKEMPVINNSRETNNVWILDCIRDSIMHGAFDVDEDKKCFIINNTQHKRELSAEVPFSWFIAYAKNDILRQRLANSYTIRGFYYNVSKKDKPYSDVKTELCNSILYRINIYGDKFKVDEVEEEIRNLVEACSKKEIDDSIVNKYKTIIEKENKKYNLKYMASFYNTCDVVEEYIREKYPELKVKIYIDDRKYRDISKISKKMQKFYLNYDLMHDDINKVLGSKGITFLKYLSNLIVSIEQRKNGLVPQENNQLLSVEEMIKKNDFALKQKEFKYVDSETIINVGSKNRNIMYNLLLSVYGLATIVVNQEELYKEHFLKGKARNYCFTAKSKQAYINYAETRRKLIIELLDIEMSLYEKQDQYTKCPNDMIKEKIKEDIDRLNERKSKALEELEKYPESAYLPDRTEMTQEDYKNKRKLEEHINSLFNHFSKANNKDDRYKIKKVIKEALMQKIEMESKYTYVNCEDMKEVLSIIRNSFSHIGRVSVNNYRAGNTTVTLNDYSSEYNGEKTAVFVYNIAELMQLLNEPYEYMEEKNILSKK